VPVFSQWGTNSRPERVCGVFILPDHAGDPGRDLYSTILSFA
jgi:hypothetical protein